MIARENRLLRAAGSGVLALLGCAGAEPGAAPSRETLPVFESPGAGGESSPGAGGASSAPASNPSAEPVAGASAEDPATSVNDLAPGQGDGNDEKPPQPPGGGGETEPDGVPSEGQTEPEPTPGPVPSAGCAQATPGPVGALSIAVGGANAAYTVTLPPGYQPGTPVPLIFGFHGRNRTHVEFQTVDASGIQTELGSRAVMAYLRSQAGPGWNFDAEVEPNVAFFEALYPVMLANYCVDTSRVFAVGHSSGGYFSNILACRFGDRIRGIASIAGATQERNCNGRVAALIIHGVRDTVVNFTGGQGSRDFYLAANRCTSTTAPAGVSPCVDYQGCDAGLPVAWCQHDEPTYENTNHGWPSFASRAASQFLFGLPRL